MHANPARQDKTDRDSQKRAVLLIDDDECLLHGLARALRHQPYRIYTAVSGDEAMLAIKGHVIDVVVADEHMPGMRGGELLAWIANHCPEIMRIVLTGRPTAETAIQAINEGRVYQFFTKPCNAAHLGIAIRKAMEHKEVLEENQRLAEDGHRRAEELDHCRRGLEGLGRLIVRDVRCPLQAIAGTSRGAGKPGEDTAPEAVTERLAAKALEALAAVEKAVDGLLRHCR
jgi:DNA-binding NtrC family response regulator